jgi:UDPglucose--hexose-1-phosphate uridylyltransferase
MEALYKNIKMLVEYAIRAGLAKECDRTYLINSLLSVFGCSSYEDVECECDASLEEILARLCDIAVDSGLIEEDSTTYRDLFDTRLMGIVTPRPSEVISEFFRLHSISPEEATDYFYRLCRSCDYIREYRVKKDLKWTVPSEFGEIDITINLSKPEKDPKAIAAAKNAKASGYPMCLLCHENEGYAGHVSSPQDKTSDRFP